MTGRSRDDQLERVWYLVTRRRFAEAEHGARRVLAHSPEDSWALRLLSITVLEQGREDEGLHVAQAACRADPDEVLNWMHLSLIHERRSEIPEAVSAAEQGVRQAPRLAKAHARLASANVSRTDPDDGQSLFDPAAGLHAADEAIRLDPGVSWVHTTRGVALSSLGRPREAQAAYRRTLQLQPNSPGALNNLAWEDIRCRPIYAARLLTRSLQMLPDWPHSRENLAHTLETWVLRMIWIVLGGSAVLIASHSLPQVLRLLVLITAGAICLVGSVTLYRALPRHSLRALWVIYPRRIGSSSLRLLAVSAIALLLAFASGPLWWCAVPVWTCQVAIEWRCDFFGFEGPLRLWDRRR